MSYWHRGGRGITLAEKSVYGRQYVGTNAFNVKVKVTERTDTECVLRVFLQPRVGPLEFFFSLPRDEARQTLQFLRVAFVGTIKAPYATLVTDHLSATVNSPLDITKIKRVAHFDPDQVWVYNYQTGQIYAKQATTF